VSIPGTSTSYLQIWDITTGAKIGPQWDFETPEATPSNATVVFAQDDQLVTSDGGITSMVGGGLGTLIWSRLLTFDNYAVVRDALCAAVGRNLTPAEWSTEVPGEPYHKTC
jgi:hypothetical protein